LVNFYKSRRCYIRADTAGVRWGSCLYSHRVRQISWWNFEWCSSDSHWKNLSVLCSLYYTKTV